MLTDASHGADVVDFMSSGGCSVVVVVVVGAFNAGGTISLNEIIMNYYDIII
jgi:hypothetical protein